VNAVKSLILYPILCVTLYYLFARAEITRFLWKRYPKWIDHWALCPACSGTWYGAAVAGFFGWYLDWPFLGLPGRFWLTPIVVGLCSTFWTPVVGNWHTNAMLRLAGADESGEIDTGVKGAKSDG